MTGTAKETVIILHGTWATPGTGKDPWYYPRDCFPDNGFVTKLDAALRNRGSTARCWAHCREGGNEFFHWSGENNWVARTRAAESLGDYVAKIREGWRCHIVTHSHGGNIVIEALPKITAASGVSEPLGRLVTLGTPFMDVITPVLKKDARRQDTIIGLGWMCFVVWIFASLQRGLPSDKFLIGLAIAALLLSAIIFRWSTLYPRQMKLSHLKEKWKFIALEVVHWTVAGMLVASVALRLSKTWLILFFILFFLVPRGHVLFKPPAPNASETLKRFPPLLAIGSRKDEAWQVLHHMRTTENPLAVKPNLIRYLLEAVQSSYAQWAAADRIYYGSFGYKAQLGAVVTWLSLLGATVMIVASAPGYITSHWSFILSEVHSFALTLLYLILILVLLFGRNYFAALLSPLRWCSRIFGSLASRQLQPI